EDSPVTYTDIPVDTASGYRHIDLSVYPIQGMGKNDAGLTAMIFTDSRKQEKPAGEDGIREKYTSTPPPPAASPTLSRNCRNRRTICARPSASWKRSTRNCRPPMRSF